MARKRRVSWLSVFYFVVTLGALVGSSVWLDRRGEPVVATVTGKTEEITVTHDPQGGWFRHYRVGADFDAAGGADVRHGDGGSSAIRRPAAG